MLPIVLDLDALPAAAVSPVVAAPVRRRPARTSLFVGRIIPNKSIDDLIRAFALYQRHCDPRSRLLLVGDYRGHERYFDRLREHGARSLGVQEVVFTGHVDHDDLLACYAAADLFLCLSEHEGFCVPLLEAMAFGVPVIAYDAGAVRETLRGGGLLLAGQGARGGGRSCCDAVLTDADLRERSSPDRRRARSSELRAHGLRRAARASAWPRCWARRMEARP